MVFLSVECASAVDAADSVEDTATCVLAGRYTVVAMRFSVLGSLEVHDDDGRPVVITSPKQRLLLALLLSQANRVVGVDRLVDLLWNGDPPASARANLQVYVHRLRRLLGEDRLVHRPPGYVMVVRPGELDADQARVLGSTREYHRALRLWRGDPYADVLDAEPLRQEADRLAEMRLDLLEHRIESDLTAARPAEMVGELTSLHREHPTRERFAVQLLLALHRGGRTTEAIQAYHDIRRRLSDELGIEPGPELRKVIGELLREETPVAERPATQPGTPGPAELPADVVGFIGRTGQLTALHGAVGSESLIAIVGVPGAGKTAMAVRFGHQVAAGYPDGALFVNLRGYAADTPMTPVDALGRLLMSLGIAARDVPTDVDGAAALFRSRLSGRRMLILLDNAGSAEQVRPLVPAAPSCLTLVTSRDRLAGLVASHGARIIALGALPSGEAHELFSSMIGPDRTRAEPSAVTEVARLCGDLPLALRIAAANLVTHPQWSLAEYVAALRQDRIARLEVDGDIGVLAAFDLSYARLPGPARRLFRLLGQAPGEDITVGAAAALADLTVRATTGLLDRLVSAHLLETPRPGRFALHDLLRSYAEQLAAREDGPEECDRAVHRVIAWYLSQSDNAAEASRNPVARLPEGVRRITPAASPFTRREEALAWLDDERGNLVAAVARAADTGSHRAAWLLADALRGYLMSRTYFAEASAVADNALRAALSDGDQHGQTVAHLLAGWVAYSRLNHEQAVDAFEAAGVAAERAHWPEGSFAANNNLAAVMRVHGQPRQALPYLRTALRASSAFGDNRMQVVTANNLAGVLLELGLLRDAEECLSQALTLLEDRTGALFSGLLITRAHALWLLGRRVEAQASAEAALVICRTTSDQIGEVHALKNLATLHCDAGRLEEALALAEEAGRKAEEVASPWLTGNVLNVLAAVQAGRDRLGEAADLYERAIRVARDSDSPDVEGRALTGVAESYRRLAQVERASAAAEESLAIARQAGRRVQEGDALLVLAAVALDRGDRPTAERQAKEALSLFTEIGHPAGVERATALLE